MKNKKFDKKLQLSKKTVANLVNVEMKDVKGGATVECTFWQSYCGYTCPKECP